MRASRQGGCVPHGHQTNEPTIPAPTFEGEVDGTDVIIVGISTPDPYTSDLFNLYWSFDNEFWQNDMVTTIPHTISDLLQDQDQVWIKVTYYASNSAGHEVESLPSDITEFVS